MSTGLDAILAPGGLRVVFQPIFEHAGDRWRVFAVEPLVRGPGASNFAVADVLFNYVRRKKEEVLVDRACVRAVMEAASRVPAAIDLSLNVHSASLARDAGFVDHVLAEASTRGIAAERLILEVIEHDPDARNPTFTDALDACRHLGLRVAVDDVGLGRSNLARLLDCRPDYFKIARYVVHRCDADHYRRALLRALQELAGDVGARVIAEGVETPGEVDAALGSGIRLFQGFALAAPRPLDDLLDLLLDQSGRRVAARGAHAAGARS